MIELSDVVKIKDLLLSQSYKISSEELDMEVMYVYRSAIIVQLDSITYRFSSPGMYVFESISRMRSEELANSLAKLDIFELSSKLLSLNITSIN
jgi:hypothetical protein